MNLATGLVKLALTEPRMPRLARIEDEVRLRFRVSPLDLDYNLHMNNARYFTAMELARIALMSRVGLLRMALRNRWVFSNAAQQALFFLPLRAFQRYTVTCGLLYMDDAWLYLKERVHSRGQLAATGLFKIRVKQGRATRSPREITELLGYDVPVVAPPPEVVEWENVNALLLEERKRAAAAPVQR